MLISNGRKTTTKTRVIANNKHQLRIDEGGYLSNKNRKAVL